MTQSIPEQIRDVPEPTLPNPNVPIGGGLPLWAGILCVAMVAAPFVFLIFSGGRW